MSAFNKRNMDSIEIRGTGNAIVKALILIELVKRRVGDLHQINNITSTEIVDEFEPVVEGLEKIEQKRRVTCLNCVLSKSPLNTDDIGYQPPTPKEETPIRTRPERGDEGNRPRGDRPQRRGPPGARGGRGRGGRRYNDEGPREERRDQRGPRDFEQRGPRGFDQRGPKGFDQRGPRFNDRDQ